MDGDGGQGGRGGPGGWSPPPGTSPGSAGGSPRSGGGGWLFKDACGVAQGPFSPHDILGYAIGGGLPGDTPVKVQAAGERPASDYRPLRNAAEDICEDELQLVRSALEGGGENGAAAAAAGAAPAAAASAAGAGGAGADLRPPIPLNFSQLRLLAASGGVAPLPLVPPDLVLVVVPAKKGWLSEEEVRALASRAGVGVEGRLAARRGSGGSAGAGGAASAGGAAGDSAVTPADAAAACFAVQQPPSPRATGAGADFFFENLGAPPLGASAGDGPPGVLALSCHAAVLKARSGVLREAIENVEEALRAAAAAGRGEVGENENAAAGGGVANSAGNRTRDLAEYVRGAGARAAAAVGGPGSPLYLFTIAAHPPAVEAVVLRLHDKLAFSDASRLPPRTLAHAYVESLRLGGAEMAEQFFRPALAVWASVEAAAAACEAVEAAGLAGDGGAGGAGGGVAAGGARVGGYSAASGGCPAVSPPPPTAGLGPDPRHFNLSASLHAPGAGMAGRGLAATASGGPQSLFHSSTLALANHSAAVLRSGRFLQLGPLAFRRFLRSDFVSVDEFQLCLAALRFWEVRRPPGGGGGDAWRRLLRALRFDLVSRPQLAALRRAARRLTRAERADLDAAVLEKLLRKIASADRLQIWRWGGRRGGVVLEGPVRSGAGAAAGGAAGGGAAGGAGGGAGGAGAAAGGAAGGAGGGAGGAAGGTVGSTGGAGGAAAAWDAAITDCGSGYAAAPGFAGFAGYASAAGLAAAGSAAAGSPGFNSRLCISAASPGDPVFLTGDARPQPSFCYAVAVTQPPAQSQLAVGVLAAGVRLPGLATVARYRECVLGFDFASSSFVYGVGVGKAGEGGVQVIGAVAVAEDAEAANAAAAGRPAAAAAGGLSGAAAAGGGLSRAAAAADISPPSAPASALRARLAAFPPEKTAAAAAFAPGAPPAASAGRRNPPASPGAHLCPPLRPGTTISASIFAGPNFIRLFVEMLAPSSRERVFGAAYEMPVKFLGAAGSTPAPAGHAAARLRPWFRARAPAVLSVPVLVE